MLPQSLAGAGSMQSGKYRPPPPVQVAATNRPKLMLQELDPCPAGNEKPSGRKGRAAGGLIESPAEPAAAAAKPVGATEGSAQDAATEVAYEVRP